MLIVNTKNISNLIGLEEDNISHILYFTSKISDFETFMELEAGLIKSNNKNLNFKIERSKIKTVGLRKKYYILWCKLE